MMFTVAAMGLLIRLAPPERRGGRVSGGAYASAFLIGSVLGPVVGGLLAASASGYRSLPTQERCWWRLGGAHHAQRRRQRGRERYTCPPGHDAQGSPGGLRLPRRHIFELWQRLGDLRRPNGHHPAVRRCRPAVSARDRCLALAIFAVGNALALTFSGRLADAWGT